MAIEYRTVEYSKVDGSVDLASFGPFLSATHQFAAIISNLIPIEFPRGNLLYTVRTKMVDKTYPIPTYKFFTLL